jgi:hypothetical protein
MSDRSFEYPLGPSLEHESEGPGDPEAEFEALEAIREAINNNNNNHNNIGSELTGATGPARETGTADHTDAGTDMPERPSAARLTLLETNIVRLQVLNAHNQAKLQNMGLQSILMGVAKKLDGLLADLKEQGEMMHEAQDGDASGEPVCRSDYQSARLTSLSALGHLDITLARAFVPRSEHDALLQKYNALLASTTTGSHVMPAAAAIAAAPSRSTIAPARSARLGSPKRLDAPDPR